MRHLLLTIPLLLLFSGCATVRDVSDKSTDEMARAADMWCVNVPESLRLAKRDEINEKTKIATLRGIDCE